MGLPTNKELGIKPTRKQHAMADKFICDALSESARTMEDFGQSPFAICPDCGKKTVIIKKCRSAAYPKLPPFLRMTCTVDECGWFGRSVDWENL